MLEENETASIDLMNMHKKAGWSQMRYNHLRKRQISSFFDQLIEDLQKNEDLTKMHGLVVAGPGEAKGQLVEMLPQALKEGRVNYLLITKGFAMPGMICKSCYHIDSDVEACPTCGSEAAALSLENHYDLAENMGTEVVLVQDDQFLESIGNSGAILRYWQDLIF